MRDAWSPPTTGPGPAVGPSPTPPHVAAAKVQREQYQQPRRVTGRHEELTRDLAEYDQAFGLLEALTEGEVA